MTTRMATTEKPEQDDLIARLAGRGDETLQKLKDLPGGTRAAKAFNDLRTRVDEMGKKVRGIDALEARVAKLEKEVATLKKAKTPARRQAPRKPASP